MSRTESDPGVIGRAPRSRLNTALGWAVTGSACVGGVWTLGLVVSLSLLHTTLSGMRRPERIPFNRALVRVLPVLVTSAGALSAAVCVAPSDLAFALLAVGALGASLGAMLYRQENRLDALERRFRGARE